MTMTMDNMNTRATGLVEALERVEAKLDKVLKQFAGPDEDDVRVMYSLTTKQHVAMQMIVQGYGNREIAEAMGVTTNTAKVHVRTVAAKLGVHTRAQITKRMLPVLDAMGEAEYRRASGGLPKDWAAQGYFGEEDGYADLYR